jgi:hypothetical protein
VADLILAIEGDIVRRLGKVREAIDRLKDLRTARIPAAVTGKIDVRTEIARDHQAEIVIYILGGNC